MRFSRPRARPLEGRCRSALSPGQRRGRLPLRRIHVRRPGSLPSGDISSCDARSTVASVGAEAPAAASCSPSGWLTVSPGPGAEARAGRPVVTAAPRAWSPSKHACAHTRVHAQPHARISPPQRARPPPHHPRPKMLPSGHWQRNHGWHRRQCFGKKEAKPEKQERGARGLGVVRPSAACVQPPPAHGGAVSGEAFSSPLEELKMSQKKHRGAFGQEHPG